jgi:hypothetical protein
MQQHAWRESRGQADWVVITAIDEHLWVRGRDMQSYLAELASDGVTCVPALGFDMNSETFPRDQSQSLELRRRATLVLRRGDRGVGTPARFSARRPTNATE